MKKLISLKQVKNTLSLSYKIKTLKIHSPKQSIVNHSFFIESTKNKYVFRIYSIKKVKSKESIQFEINAMNLLRKAKFRVPKIIKNILKEDITEQIYGNKKYYCILMNFIDGKTLNRKDIYLVEQLGKMQAKLHKFMQKRVKSRTKIGQVLKQWAKYSREETEKIKPILKKYGLGKVYLKKFEEVKKELALKLPLVYTMPHAECHNDFFGGNILIKNKKIYGIIDFDNISVSPLVFDIANTLRAWMYQSNPKKYETIYKKYLHGYQSQRKLSVAEYEILPVFIAIRNFVVNNFLLIHNINERKNVNWIQQTIKFHDRWRQYRTHTQLSAMADKKVL